MSLRAICSFHSGVNLTHFKTECYEHGAFKKDRTYGTYYFWLFLYPRNALTGSRCGIPGYRINRAYSTHSLKTLNGCINSICKSLAELIQTLFGMDSKLNSK
jgi:hypothetical protein